MKLSELKIDAAKADRGAWVRDIPDMGEVAFKVRGIGNPDWRRLSARLYDAVPRSKRPNGKVDPTEADKIVSECLIETALLDWSGLSQDDGKPLAYSKKMARELIVNPDYAQFRAAVLYAAGVVAQDGVENIEEAAGN